AELDAAGVELVGRLSEREGDAAP
ncbi:nicotinamidase, partial [Rhodococcus hoagii]|nr:nicotinamidase [Prescottella equi]